ncbi:hypothetical protein [Streptomyces sp. MNP-20]|uniref:hypothetical protein n=2 Tax=Streptomyces sp. MNP-20 TaxID=2721165 RepID=UPI0015562EAB|nr:hypothetical protein [Streptomyces sp. MNP-20]
MSRTPLGSESGVIAQSETPAPQGEKKMFDYEIHQFRAAELAQEAARHRLVREARKAATPRRRVLGREGAEARLTAARTGAADRYTRAA